jgi:hypothetical protein
MEPTGLHPQQAVAAVGECVGQVRGEHMPVAGGGGCVY